MVLAKTIEEREALRTWLIETLNEQFPALRSRVRTPGGLARRSVIRCSSG